MRFRDRLAAVSWLRLTAIIVFIAIFDQWSKYLILERFSVGERLEVIPGFFNLVLVYNRGAAFGFLNGVEDPWRLIILNSATLLALGAIFYFLLFEYLGNRRVECWLALILGGAVGNLIDRTTIGAVVDFLDFYVSSYHWPAFNVADSAICVGVGFIIVEQIFFSPPHGQGTRA